ncbi:hypothetical protein J3R74_001492 [Puniceicoccus vermicola]
MTLRDAVMVLVASAWVLLGLAQRSVTNLLECE